MGLGGGREGGIVKRRGGGGFLVQSKQAPASTRSIATIVVSEYRIRRIMSIKYRPGSPPLLSDERVPEVPQSAILAGRLHAAHELSRSNISLCALFCPRGNKRWAGIRGSRFRSVGYFGVTGLDRVGGWVGGWIGPRFCFSFFFVWRIYIYVFESPLSVWRFN